MSCIGEVIELLRRSNCIKLGKFVLSSGAESSIYIDLRSILSHPREFKLLVKLCSKSIENLNFDILAGIESSGIPLATALALEHEKPMIYVRKEAKAHGLAKRIEGDIFLDGRALIIDDVATTGSSIESAVKALRSEGLAVSDAFVVVDREEGARERLDSIGVRLSSLITLSQLVSGLEAAGGDPGC